MDPNATWKEMADAFEKANPGEEWEIVEEYADNLLEWLLKGGVPPNITGLRDFDKLIATKTCEAILEGNV